MTSEEGKRKLQTKYSNQKKNRRKTKFRKTSSEWITEVMSQAAKEPQQDGTLSKCHFLSHGEGVSGHQAVNGHPYQLTCN